MKTKHHSEEVVMHNVKQSARNNEVLARIKREYNAPIYKHSLEIMNGAGAEALEEYLGQFTNDEHRAKSMNRIFRGVA